MSLSNITISGTVIKNPEKRFTPTNIAVANFVIAVTFIPRGQQNDQQKEIKSQTIRVNAWRDLAELCEAKIKAGDKILIIGRVQINAYTNQEGKKKREIEIDATSVSLLKDVLSLQLPQKDEKEEERKDTFKKSTSDAEPVSNLEEVLTSTEEIPF